MNEILVRYNGLQIVKMLIPGGDGFYYFFWTNDKNTFIADISPRPEEMTNIDFYEELHNTEYPAAIKFLFFNRLDEW